MGKGPNPPTQTAAHLEASLCQAGIVGRVDRDGMPAGGVGLGAAVFRFAKSARRREDRYMVEVVVHPPGTFCFIEAGSADIEAAHRFYGGLLGWEGDDRLLPDGSRYTRFLLQGRPVAGMYGIRGEQEAVAIPSQWVSYVSVEDAVATLEKAIDFGATRFGDVVEVPGIVTVAEFVDPGGALCGLWQPGAHIGSGYVDEPGTCTWNELLVSDFTTAAVFYCNVFDWTHETRELPSGPYHFFRSGPALRGGMTTISSEMGEVSPSWRAHIAVTDLDAAMSKVTVLGGFVNEGAVDDIPEIGRRTAVRDPAGIGFTLMELASHD